jgi:hypothetical protein
VEAANTLDRKLGEKLSKSMAENRKGEKIKETLI